MTRGSDTSGWPSTGSPSSRPPARATTDTPVSVGCSAQDQADALAELLDTLGIGQAHVVAISAAGHVGIELARRHPDRIDRCRSSRPSPCRGQPGSDAAAGSCSDPFRAGLGLDPRQPAHRAVGRPATAAHAADDARRGAVVRDMDDETRDRYLAAFRSLWSGRGFACDLGHDSPSDAPILQPTLILRGAHDRPVPPAHAARLAALAPHHELVEVDAESHFIWFGRAASEVWDRRLAFLGGESG